MPDGHFQVVQLVVLCIGHRVKKAAGHQMVAHHEPCHEVRRLIRVAVKVRAIAAAREL